MPIIPGIIASEASAHLQPQPPFIDTISGAVVISGGTTSGSNSVVNVYLTPNPLGHPATSYGVTAFSGSPLVAISGTTITGATNPLTITYPFVANAYYQFEGYASNKYGNSKYGNASNQVEPFIATATPSGLSVVITSLSGVQYTFLQVPNAASYILSATGTLTNIGTGLTTQDSATLTISGPGTSPTVTGLMNHGFLAGMPYTFYVQSQNFAGTSASGANIVLTPNPLTAPTVAPTFTATKSGNNGFINIVITNVDTNPLHSLADNYTYSDANNGFTSSTQSATTYTMSGITNPIEPVAVVNVIANNAIGRTPGTPQNLLYPPAAVTGVNTSSISYSSATVAWTPTAANTQYSQPTTYSVALTCSSPYDQVSTSVPYATNIATLNGSKTFTLYGTTYTNVFQAGASYTPTVVAQNTGGSSTSATTTAIIPNPLPSAVTGVLTSSVTTTSTTISWTPAGSGITPATYVALMVGSDSTSFYTSVAYGTNSAVVTGSFTKGITYTPTVISITAGGAQTSATGTGIIPNPLPNVTATNATHYSDSTYDYAVWRTTGTLLITNSNLANVEILAVGAGGGGGAYRTVTGGYAGGGGGGAGQILAQSYGTLGTTAINVTIGAGGAGGSGGSGGIGGGSNLIYNSPPYTNLFSVYGGGGGGYNGAGVNGANGGGGSANNGAGGTGLNASTGQSNGYKGGTGYVQTAGSAEFAGGGGGAFQDGQGGITNSNGGAGLQFSDWSSATSTGDSGYYAGGGGGGESNDSLDLWGKGGAGGGGVGASLNANSRQATAGTANTGGGGGGAAGPSYSTAGAGGSGLIILRWPLGTATIGF